MSEFLKPSSPIRMGHMLMTAVFIAVPVLMFLPNLMVALDSQSIDVGDRVTVRSGGGGEVIAIHGDTATVQATYGQFEADLSEITEQ